MSLPRNLAANLSADPNSVTNLDGLSPAQLLQFDRDGFLVIHKAVDSDWCDAIRQLTDDHLQRHIQPLEYEADLHYPGSPESRNARGGKTVRRLLQAQSRDPLIMRFINDTGLQTCLRQLLKNPVVMSLAHHNCIMTKHPSFSSETHWHQDIRYWSFQQAELINTWIALGREYHDNGGMKVIPGSHKLDIDLEQLGDELFFRTDLEKNRVTLAKSVDVDLSKGDILLFHCRTLHAAGKNTAAEAKYSAVFTFHAAENKAVAGTRSAKFPELVFP
ncbi:MAG: phytanoyl-CoA dioxygenase family protein [Gammaproteobacteria bacterium]